MALIDNEKLYENIEKKLELIKAAKEQPVIMKPFIKDFAYRFCWSSNALEGNTLSLDETICLIQASVISLFCNGSISFLIALYKFFAS